MTGKKGCAEEEIRGESYVENGGTTTRLVESRAAKEISSVNGDNPYPGTNDGGMDGGRSEREGAGMEKSAEERKEERGSRKGGTTLSWFPSGGFIMASSYYRRIHGHDANLRQGRADLTSTRTYSAREYTDSGAEANPVERKTRDIRRVRIVDKDCPLLR